MTDITVKFKQNFRSNFHIMLTALMLRVAMFLAVWGLSAIMHDAGFIPLNFIGWSLLLFGIFTACAVLRWKVSHPYILIIAHVPIIIAAQFFVPVLVAAGATAGIALFSPGAHEGRFQGIVLFCHVFAVIFMVVAVLFDSYFSNFLFPALAVALFSFGIFYQNLFKMNITIESFTGRSAQPITRIRNFNIILMLGIALTVIAMMFFFRIAFLDRALETVLTRPAAVREARPPADEIDGITQHYTPASERYEGDPFAIEGRGAGRLTLLLETLVFRILVPIAILFGIFLLIRQLLKIEKSDTIRQKKNLTIDSGEDECEFLENEPLFSKLRNFFKNQEPTDPVRKKFYQTMTKQIKAGVPIAKSDTPSQMAQRINTPEIHSLAADYHKARYGGLAK